MAKAKIKNLEQFIEDIQADAHKYATNIAKYMAQDIADEMRDVARSAINTFYNQYDPEDPSKHNGQIYYYRHWNFEKSFRRYYRNRDPYFIGGVVLLRNELPNVYTGRKSSPHNVFDRVYAGYHGIASFQDCNPPVPIMRPSPHKIITDKFKEIQKNLKDYENKAAKKAQGDSYKYIF